MTFTYTDTLATDLDEIRFQIQDTVENNGVKPIVDASADPNGSNFSNEEITGLLALEITVGRTIARLYETLAVSWANYVDTKIGSRDEKLSKIADNYRAMAAEWRAKHGGGSGFVIGIGSMDEGISEDEPT